MQGELDSYRYEAQLVGLLSQAERTNNKRLAKAFRQLLSKIKARRAGRATG